MIEKLLSLLLSSYTILMSGYEHINISLVIPVLLELKIHLQDEKTRVFLLTKTNGS